MLLSKNLVETFRTLYLKKSGVETSYAVAEAQLKDLAELVRLTLKTEIL